VLARTAGVEILLVAIMSTRVGHQKLPARRRDPPFAARWVGRRPRVPPAALENPGNFVASCQSDRFIGIDHCWIEATQ